MLHLACPFLTCLVGRPLDAPNAALEIWPCWLNPFPIMALETPPEPFPLCVIISPRLAGCMQVAGAC